MGRVDKRILNRTHRLTVLLIKQSGREVEGLETSEVRMYSDISMDLMTKYPTLLLDKTTLTMIEKDSNR